MTAHNDIVASRLHQLFIRGLRELATLSLARVMPGALRNFLRR